MSEWNRLINKYSKIAFNDVPSKRNKNHSLLAVEPIVILPQMYQLEVMRQYKLVYTWNSKLRDILGKNGIDCVLLNGFPIFDNYSNPFYILESMNFDDRKDLSLICRYRINMIHEKDITNLRYSVFNGIDLKQKECFGKVPYLSEYYKGPIGNNQAETSPSSNAKLLKMNEFKFNLCFENCYDELWSNNYITEKIIDCFKAKTIPIYYGASNIELLIPNDLYIDYRDFKDINELNKYLKAFTKSQSESMTERAFEFVSNKFNFWGNIKILEEIIRETEDDCN